MRQFIDWYIVAGAIVGAVPAFLREISWLWVSVPVGTAVAFILPYLVRKHTVRKVGIKSKPKEVPK